MSQEEIRRKLVEKINDEFNAFRYDMIERGASTVFSNSFEISAKTNLKDFLTEWSDELDDEYIEALAEFGPGLLSELYDRYINDEYASVDNIPNTRKFVRNFAERLI